MTSTTPFSSAVSAPPRLPSARHLHVALLESGLLHHQHAHHLAERFRIADAELLALQVGRGLERRIGHHDHDEVGERPRREADDLDVLALVGGGDHRSGGDVAVAERRRHRVAHRAAAAGAGDDAGDVDAVLLEQALLERDRVGRAGWIVLVLGDEEICSVGRPSRGKTKRRDGDDVLETHYHVLPEMTCSTPALRRRSRPSAAIGPA